MDCFWGGSRGRSADPGAFADLVGPGGVLGGIPEGSWCVLGWFGISSIWVPCCRISGRTVRTLYLLTQSFPLRPLRPPAAPAVSPPRPFISGKKLFSFLSQSFKGCRVYFHLLMERLSRNSRSCLVPFSAPELARSLACDHVTYDYIIMIMLARCA